jgi:hypothetical protein
MNQCESGGSRPVAVAVGPGGLAASWVYGNSSDDDSVGTVDEVVEQGVTLFEITIGNRS